MSALSLIQRLKELYPDSSTNSLREWIAEGRVLLEGRPITRGNFLISPEASITLKSRQRRVEGGISILYEDAHLVAIEKPSGLLSVATAFTHEKTAHAFLKDYFHPRLVEVVHRLDQDTSGVMLFALSEKGRDGLKALLERHDIERVYYAIVEGTPTPLVGTWKSYLIEDAQYVVKVVKEVSSGAQPGKLAITHYRVLASRPSYSWLELRLETGRKNQIRVHCQEAGHSVVGDKKYGSHHNPLKRLCLHAHRFACIHPVTGKPLVFISPPPEAFFRLASPTSF